jgi:hypothetical protein
VAGYDGGKIMKRDRKISRIGEQLSEQDINPNDMGERGFDRMVRAEIF